MPVWQMNPTGTASIVVHRAVTSALRAGIQELEAFVQCSAQDGVWRGATAVTAFLSYPVVAPIVSMSADCVHITSGGAWAYTSPPALPFGEGLQVVRSLAVTCVLQPQSHHLKPLSVLEQTATCWVADVKPPGGVLEAGRGGLGELYFRIVAGRPCQIALGTATRKRIQSISPQLPAALRVSSDGYYITGTPIVTGVHSLAVTADDGSELALTIEVLPASFVIR